MTNLDKWDEYMKDKPELKEIIGELAKAVQNLNMRLSKLEREQMGGI